MISVDCSVMNTKSKYLSRGERRRLSIAEEIVHGPSLLFIDEPCSSLSLLDESVLMMTFREMVNQDKTVVASVHQPSPSSFKLFDSILLLSKGRVVYHGVANGATKFFIQSPYNFDFSAYVNNPGDFLVDISAGQIEDVKKDIIDSTSLEIYYQSSELYKNLSTRIEKLKTRVARANVPTSKNPMNETFDEESANRRSTSFDVESPSNQQDAAGTISAFMASPYIPSVFRLIIIAAMEFFTCRPTDFETFFFKAGIVLQRAFVSLYRGWELTLGSMTLYILLACIFGWIIGDASKQIYNSTSFFAIGALILLICNVYFISHLFKSNEVSSILTFVTIVMTIRS